MDFQEMFGKVSKEFEAEVKQEMSEEKLRKTLRDLDEVVACIRELQEYLILTHFLKTVLKP